MDEASFMYSLSAHKKLPRKIDGIVDRHATRILLTDVAAKITSCHQLKDEVNLTLIKRAMEEFKELDDVRVILKAF